ncbi:MAG: bifunctional 4-hydroxy-2-oxoglutarate aldolase/2-dehydro-3-deoxy-phosphogluconate aldolase [Pseudomonadales bacterium]|nr:bifunctional 4-hydroxy-2-oxoglutarate aldolase/2-dehydro-3-deoxy-phosphogluconate aldolase [Pseudomonadales bacterium]
MKIEDFLEVPVMGILRGIELDNIEGLVEALSQTPLKCIEITMNTPGAATLIKELKFLVKGKMSVGAGTVLSLDEFDLAINAGAEFIVSPVLVKEVVTACVDQGIPVFPGAFSPQEIYDAYQAGASMVKVFPCKTLGPGYIKEIRGPFPDIPLLACGGVNAGNVGEFFDNGATGVAFDGSIFQNDLMNRGEFDEIVRKVKAIVAPVLPR